MDLSTKYLGLDLRSPLVAAPSPLSASLADIRRMEDAGAGAVVLFSLFEEQLRGEAGELVAGTTGNEGSSAEAATYFPEPFDYRMGPEDYLEHIRKAKAAVKIPVIASLNGITRGGWIDFAKKVEQAGADALELNVYSVPTNVATQGAFVDMNVLDITRGVTAAVQIPVAVKLSPYYSSVAGLARQLGEAGARGLVLFNRFYQPDIDLDTMEVEPHILLSTPQDLRLPLRWIAILHGRVQTSLAASGGVHTGADALKMLLAGADVVQMASALLKNGIDHMRLVEREMTRWMEEKEYVSVAQLRGSMSHKNVADPSAFERSQYMKAFNKYKV